MADTIGEVLTAVSQLGRGRAAEQKMTDAKLVTIKTQIEKVSGDLQELSKVIEAEFASRNAALDAMIGEAPTP